MLFLSRGAFPHPALGRAPPLLEPPPPLLLEPLPPLLELLPLLLELLPLLLELLPLLLDLAPLDPPPDDEPPLELPGWSSPPPGVSTIPGSQATSASDEASTSCQGVIVGR